jgi:Tol biopolymer transport system component
VKRKSLSNWQVFGAATVMASIVLASQVEPEGLAQRRARRQAPQSVRDTSACGVQELKKSEIQGLKVYSPDGTRFLINKEDEKGTAQIYIGTGNAALTCITCAERTGGPKRERFKMQPVWHPSGRWIFLAVERDKFSPPPLLGMSRKYVEGMLQSGLWTNMYAISPDGFKWHRLTDFKSNVKGTADGYTGPAFTPDGKRAVWSQVVDGNIFRYHPFGRWELILADFEEKNGIPTFSNPKNITPKDMHWNEPGDFSPDNVSLLMTGSVEKDAQGMDQYILNIRTNNLTNLTNSPTVWDEHGLFSPDGEKVMFMSAYPYRTDPKASKVTSIKTEFMLMNKDGSGLTQLTHFKEPGYPEYGDGIAATQIWSPDGRSANLARLVFPKYEYWNLVFRGPCGKNGVRQ